MESVYDEFGNYIGPELDHDDDDERDDEGQSEGERDTEEWEERDDAPSHSAGDADGRRSPPSSSPHVDGTASPSDPTARAVQLGSVLAASSSSSSSSSLVPSYYPSAAELYGSETEVVVGDEDAQAIETPLIAPLQTHAFAHVEAELPRCTWDWRYLAGLMDHPDLIRHVAVIGHLHHGKTALLDLLVENTHAAPASGKRPTRYTDSGVAEQQRGVSIKCAPMSFVLPSLSSKSFLVNIMDTPGHVDFSDEVTAALRIADTALLVVDAAEGMQLQSRRLLQHAVREGLRVLLLINKVDRLIVELKLPPTDAYHKLHLIVEDVNGLLQAAGSAQRVSPAANSVVFASSAHSFLFSLRSFAQLYAHAHPEAALDHRVFARRLWGNSFLGADGRFSSTPQSGSSTRSFVAFILEPLYKLYAHVLGSEGPQLKALLQELGVQVTKAELNLDSKALLRIVLSRVFGGVEALTEALVEHGPSPVHAADAKVRHVYTGLVNSPAAQAMLSCSRTGVAMLHVTKLFCRHDAAVFDAFGRVFSGHLKVGDTVRVLGEGYSLDDEEDSSMRTITRIWVYNARYRVEVSGVGAGNWALFEGIDAPISKTATVTSSTASDVSIFRPLAFDTIGPMKVAIEPLNPSELPKMLEGLRRVTKTYPLSSTKVEESGEHVLMGPGELYLDCALHDLRKAYSDIEVRVSDPVVRFCETVVDTSQLECRALSGNGANRLSMVAEPLEPAIADDIEHGRLRVGAGKEEDERTRARLEREYGWDVLQSRSIWAFGPDDQGPNILVDETLPAEVSLSRTHTAPHPAAPRHSTAALEH